MRRGEGRRRGDCRRCRKRRSGAEQWVSPFKLKRTDEDRGANNHQEEAAGPDQWE